MKFYAVVLIAVVMVLACIGCSEEQAEKCASASIAPEPEVKSCSKATEPEAQPAEADTETIDTDPFETKTVEVEPIEAEPVEAEPVEAEPVEAVPVEAEPVEAEPAAVEDTVEDPQKVLVTVNGDQIKQGLVTEKMQAQLEMIKSTGQPIPEDMLGQLKDRTLDMIIVELLLTQKFAAKDIVIGPEQIEAKIAEIAGQQGTTVEGFKQRLAGTGMDEAELSRQISMGIGFEKLVEAEMSDTTVSDEDAQKFYDETPQHFNKPEKVQASHILIATKDLDEAGKAEAMAKTEGLLAQVKDGGDFAELAKANSACPSGQKGGDLGLFGPGQMVPEFNDAAFAMEVGQVSDVVETQFGYHIIKVTDKQEASVVSFDEAKPQIIDNLQGQKKNEFSMSFMTKMKEDAEIIYADKPEEPVAEKETVEEAPPAESN